MKEPNGITVYNEENLKYQGEQEDKRACPSKGFHPDALNVCCFCSNRYGCWGIYQKEKDTYETQREETERREIRMGTKK